MLNRILFTPRKGTVAPTGHMPFFVFWWFLSSLLLHCQTVLVNTSPEGLRNRFVPNQSLGAGLDRISTEAVPLSLSKRVLDAVAPSGWGPITYRNNTELAVEAWHWNPQGKWSEAGEKGYFTGSATPGKDIENSFGFTLPRRGFTRNDGTGNTGFSRLTDGDTKTFWKSNPYLSEAYTGEPDAKHPQWIIIDLKRKELVDSVKIAWALPFAKRFHIQYWTGEDPIGKPTVGAWQMLPAGEVDDSKGGEETVRISKLPVQIEFLRIVMTESSGTCDAGAQTDRRNCVGYAVREVYVGTSTADGGFHDVLRHTPDQDQSSTYCSSVDPWHTAKDLENTRQSQPGLDAFYRSGITHGLPAMVPVSLIYNVPEDAVAEIAYLRSRKYPISYVEMGEEADGQYMAPEDYAALYLQFATALHHLDSTLKLGGPAFQGSLEDIVTWPDAEGRTSWLGRFVLYLRQHDRLGDLAFFSFEHYPLSGCHFAWTGLYDEPFAVNHIMQTWANDGLPSNIPVFITESNLSATPGEAYMDNFAGLWLADYIGSFLTAGGSGVYYFHYLPLASDLGCGNSPGTFGMFHVNKGYDKLQPLAQFFASELINTEWVQPGGGTHEVYASTPTYPDNANHWLVTAYSLHRPDDQWSVLLVNRDQSAAHKVRIVFGDPQTGKYNALKDEVHYTAFGSGEYAWHPSPVRPMAHPLQLGELVISPDLGYAEPDGPPKQATLTLKAGDEIEVPAATIVVVRGRLGELPAGFPLDIPNPAPAY